MCITIGRPRTYLSCMEPPVYTFLQPATLLLVICLHCIETKAYSMQSLVTYGTAYFATESTPILLKSQSNF